MALHVRKIVLPDSVIARPGEVPAVLFRGEVVRANRKEGFASELEEVARRTQCIACLKGGKVADYKTVLREFLGCAAPIGCPGGANGINAGRKCLAEGKSGVGSVGL